MGLLGSIKDPEQAANLLLGLLSPGATVGSAKKNIGLLLSDPKEFMRQSEEFAKKFREDRLSNIAAAQSVMPEVSGPANEALLQDVMGLLGTIKVPDNTVKSFVNYAKENSGATLDVETLSGLAKGDKKLPGYAVARSGPMGQKLESVSNTISEKQVKEFIRSNQGALSQPGAKLGAWLDNGKWYLDVSEGIPAHKAAADAVRTRDQIAAFRQLPYNIETASGYRDFSFPEFNIEKDASQGLLQGGGNKPAPFSIISPRKTVIGGTTVNPKIYQNPQKIVNDSARLIAPESTLLSELFGVTRNDLDMMQLQRQDPSIASGLLALNTKSGKTPQHLGPVLTEGNAKRMREIIQIASEDPRFAGMPGWYFTDPLLWKATDLLGPKEGMDFYVRHHLFASPMSAQNTVDKEIAKGTWAQLLDAQGRLGEFFAKENVPPGLGSFGHTTAHASGARRLQQTGGQSFWTPGDPSPKTPAYFDTKLGRNYYFPVGDAHFSRGIGLPDTRPWVPEVKNRTKTGLWIPDESSIGATELPAVSEWYNKEVTGPLGLSGAVGHPIQWGAMADATGVKSAIGAPYLEILAMNAEKAGRRQGISAKEALDNYILGAAGKKAVDPYRAYLGNIDPELLAILGIGGGGLLGYNLMQE